MVSPACSTWLSRGNAVTGTHGFDTESNSDIMCVKLQTKKQTPKKIGKHTPKSKAIVF